MPVVNETLNLPGGSAAAASVDVYLVGTDGKPETGYVSGTAITGKHTPTVSTSTGAWTATLTANSLITPSGTRWRVDRYIGGRQWGDSSYLAVPNGAGPYDVDDILDEVPASVGSSALAAAVAALVPVTVVATPLTLPTTDNDGGAALHVSTTWTDLDSTGSAAARNLDIVLSDVAAGQWVWIEPNGYWNNEASIAYLDAFTIVSGSAVNQFTGTAANLGVASWAGLASLYSFCTGRVWYQLQAGDIEDGSVRIRLKYKANGVKQIIANFQGARFSITGAANPVAA